MLSVNWTGIHLRLLDHHVAFAWLGFVLPCIIATLYLVWRRDGISKWHWLLWVLGTVATYYFALRITPRGIKMIPLYVVALGFVYVLPGIVRWRAPRLPAGTIGALAFFSMALIDIAAALTMTPEGRFTVLGGAGTGDMLVRTPLQVAIMWACMQIILQTRVQRRPRRLIHPPGNELLRFHFSLRTAPRPEPMRA